MDRVDCVIAGGGAAGLALALALKSAGGDALDVALCDPALAAPARGDARAYAIVAGARRFFQQIGAWEGMADAAQPMLGMDITDSRLEDLYRPLFLDFQAPEDDMTDGPFAHVIPNGAIIAALTGAARAAGVRLMATGVTSFTHAGGRIIAETGAGALSARLLAAADGRGSRLREQAGIPSYGWAYPQSAIVGTVRHSLPHEGMAVQHFLPAGPFALLPLRGADGTGHESSLVWNEAPADAARLLKLDRDDLLAEIDRRAAGRFGTMREARGLAALPLSLNIARRFCGERLALLGDAAHGMHPLAGQGLNYGLRGAAALAEAILDAARLGLDIGSDETLDAYERARRADVMGMALATESLNRLFSTDIGPVRALRDLGLGLVNRLPRLKGRFMTEAAGGGALAPRAFRGLPV